MGLFSFLTNWSSAVIQISNIHDIQNGSAPHIKLLKMASTTYSAHPGRCANSESLAPHSFGSSFLGLLPGLPSPSLGTCFYSCWSSHTVPSGGLSQHVQSPLANTWSEPQAVIISCFIHISNAFRQVSPGLSGFWRSQTAAFVHLQPVPLLIQYHPSLPVSLHPLLQQRLIGIYHIPSTINELISVFIQRLSSECLL